MAVQKGKDIRYYAKQFSALRVDRSRGIAPHKPLLLLAVIELIEQGIIPQNRIFLSPDLIAEFIKYWSQLGTQNHNSDIALPFFHLTSDKFWHLKPNPNFEVVISSHIKVKTIRAIQNAVQYAYLDDELFAFLQNESTRKELVAILIQTWFSDKSHQVEQLFQTNAFEELQSRLLESGGEVYKPDVVEDEATNIVRDAAFRRNIIAVYHYKCAFCRLQIVSTLGQNIVDGAHIKPFSKFYDDRIENGLSLCKNHHWAFDRGWFSVNDNYQVLLSPDLKEESPYAEPLSFFQGKPILLPQKEQFFPSLESLAWHRENVFNGD